MKIDLNEIKNRLTEDSRKALWFNIGLMGGIAVFLIIIFFYVYLPIITHHGETITVPDLEGMQLAQVEDFLDDRDLRYYVADSSYDHKLPPLTVLKQDPEEGAKVKVNRRIHITINSKMPPMERLPNIIDNSMKQASQILESYGFKIGKIDYVADIVPNTVLKVFVNGKEITEQELVGEFKIPKGTKIDLHVGDGMGKNDIIMPDLTGKLQEEAEFYLKAIGLGVGGVMTEKDDTKELGTVIRQKPAVGTKVKVGTIVDIWVSGDEN
ncbi:MAG: PASTA domain-containing protein [Thermoflexibacter sp.]|nr:PASTA domain-containing protein [Thermoflexibacter sp.]